MEKEIRKILIHSFVGSYGREPIIRRMPDGRLICTFLSGGPYEPHNENTVMLAESFDDGESWTEPTVLFSHGKRGVWCTECYTEGFGDTAKPVLAVHTYNADCIYGELQTFISESDDGAVWSEPHSLPYGINGVTLRQGFKMSNGEVMFPLYWQQTLTGFDWAKVKSVFEHSRFVSGAAVVSDNGKTWQRYGYITGEGSLWEPNAVELEPGHLRMYMRSGGGYLAYSDSFDYARTWTDAAMSDIPNPYTKISVTRLGDTIIMANNFHNVAGWTQRTHLQLRVSRDFCKTWEYIYSPEDDGECWFYPHMYLDLDRRVLYLAYENSIEHRLVKLPFDMLGV